MGNLRDIIDPLDPGDVGEHDCRFPRQGIARPRPMVRILTHFGPDRILFAPWVLDERLLGEGVDGHVRRRRQDRADR